MKAAPCYSSRLAALFWRGAAADVQGGRVVENLVNRGPKVWQEVIKSLQRICYSVFENFEVCSLALGSL